MPSGIETTVTEMRALRRQMRDDLAIEQRRLAADERLTDSAKRSDLADFRAKQSSEAKTAAFAAWQKAMKARERVARERASTSPVANESLDYARVGILRDDYAAQIASAPANSAGFAESRAAVIDRLLEAAEASGSKEHLRAVRIAAQPELEQLRGIAGTDGQRASELRRRLRSLADADLGIEGDDPLAEADLELALLRGEISALEPEVTGRNRGVFQPLTDWDRDVFGETLESIGAVAPLRPAGG